MSTEDTISPKSFIDIYSRAPVAKIEIDNLSEKIASKYDGTVVKAPIKSEERDYYIQSGLDAVESYLPGVPSASKVGYGVAIGHEVYDQLTGEDK